MCFFHSSSVIANFTVFRNLLMVLSSSNLHEPKGLESALTCLIIRTIYGETMATPQFTVISPVGNSPYKAAGEKNSSDAASVVTLNYDHPGLSQITARSLSPGRRTFITFMTYVFRHSNMAHLWCMLTAFLPLPEGKSDGEKNCWQI